LQHHDVTWIATAAGEEDRAVATRAVAEQGNESGNGTVLLAHDPVAYHRYYNVVANPMLWFIHHSLWGRALQPQLGPEFHEAWDHGYVTVNRSFADAVVEQLDAHPGATVFFHDYHLYLAPRMVREARPDATLAHFVHVPWPTDWTVLPERLRHAIHDGLLANDVVGFHTARWARNFEHSCGEVCGGCETTVTHHAISIDVAEFERLRTDEQVLAAEAALERPEKLVLRVDRTDPSKNIVRGCLAFRLLLDQHPEWRGRARLLAFLDPSRQTIPEYVDYLKAVEEAVSAVNARHPGAVQLRVADDFPQSVAAYKQFDVLLVNAVYDGLNLVAKEGPLVNERDGVLVLSENTGAHEELGEWAVTINPFDVQGQADALHDALSMDAPERRRRLEAIKAHVRAHDVSEWIAAQLADVDRVSA
jgi:trehalose 6-phosphate synthase